MIENMESMEDSPTIRKFAIDIGWIFISQVFTIFLGFLLRIFLGRFLGPGGLGLYAMTFTVYSLAGLVGGVGIPTALVKFASEHKGNREKLNPFISSAIINSMIFGVVVGFLIFHISGMIANFFNMPELNSLIKIIGIALPFLILNNTLLLGLCTGIRDMKLHGLGIACRSILLFGLAVLFVSIGWGVKGVVSAIMFSEIGTFILSHLLTRKHFNFSIQDYPQTTKVLIPFGTRLFLASAIFTFNTNADRLFIGFFLTDKDVGIYAIALAIAAAFQIIPGVISRVTYPMMSEYDGKEMHQENEILINKTMKYTLIILSLLGLLIIFLSEDIIFVLLGREFLSAVLPATILVFAMIFFGSMASIGSAFSAAGRPDIPYKLNLVSLSVNILLDMMLIPIIGISGAAIGTATSLMVLTTLSIWILYRALKVTVDIRHYVVTFLTVPIMIALLFFCRDTARPYLLGGVVLGLYGIIMLFYLFKKEDRENIKKVFMDVIGKRRS